MRAEVVVNIVDDDEAVRHALGMLMQSVKLATQSFGSAREFLDGFDPTRPGCVVLDIRMPEMSGLDLQRELAHRGLRIPIIFITGHGDVPMAVRALREGAMDFIEKPFHDQELLDSISRAVSRSVDMLREQRARASFLTHSNALSLRERQVMELLVAGKCSKEIALQLSISPKTVDVHRGHIMDKMRAKSLVELVHLANFQRPEVEA